MSEKNYSTADIQAVANGIRKQILGVALKTGGCYLAQACSSAEIIASVHPCDEPRSVRRQLGADSVPRRSGAG